MQHRVRGGEDDDGGGGGDDDDDVDPAAKYQKFITAESVSLNITLHHFLITKNRNF